MKALRFPNDMMPRGRRWKNAKAWTNVRNGETNQKRSVPMPGKHTTTSSTRWALKIQNRARRRMGELLRQVEKQQGQRSDLGGSLLPSRRKAADGAGISLDQAKQAKAIRAGDLVPRAETEKVWIAEIVAVRAKLLAWPATLSDRLYREGMRGSAGGIELALKVAVDEVLLELSTGARPPKPRAKKRTARK